MPNVVKIPAEYRPKIDDLPGELSFIARAIDEHIPGQGVEITLLLAQIFPGQPLYMHNVKKLLINMRDDAIRAEYDAGASVKQLAYKFSLSTRWIEDILSRGDTVDDRQLRLF